MTNLVNSKIFNKKNIYKFFRFRNFKKHTFFWKVKRKPLALSISSKYRSYSLSCLYNNNTIVHYSETHVYILTKILHNFEKYSILGYEYWIYSVNKFVNSLKNFKPLEILYFRKFYSSNTIFKNLAPVLMMSFRRRRLFCSLQSRSKTTHVNYSLGMFSVYLHKGKSFTKNKSNYILMASFLRKVIMYSCLKNIYLLVKHIPIYLNELISTVNRKSINFYKDPFSGKLISETGKKNAFNFRVFMFFNNKPYGFIKTRKKGRIKRKITKRLVKLNRVAD